jgi:hypothetical protein
VTRDLLDEEAWRKLLLAARAAPPQPQIPTGLKRASAQLRVIFDRPAFRETCIKELSLKHLQQALDDTQTALSTGKLYSRGGNLLICDFSPPDAETLLPELRQMLSSRSDWEEFKRFASAQLRTLSRLIAVFEERIGQVYPDYWRHNVFFTMVAPALDTAEPQAARELCLLMDQIDHERNVLIREVNCRLSEAGLSELPLPELSSEGEQRWQHREWMLEHSGRAGEADWPELPPDRVLRRLRLLVPGKARLRIRRRS